MLLGKILGVSGLLHFYLAHKGYIYGKGKNNIFGVLITTCISFAFTILGTYLGYIGVILKSLLKDSEMKLLSFLELLKKSFAFVQNPEVKKELFTNLKLSLFLCGICIVFAMIQAIRSTRKVKIKKA